MKLKQVQFFRACRRIFCPVFQNGDMTNRVQLHNIFPSINQAKKWSREKQMAIDTNLGLGSVQIIHEDAVIARS